MKPALSWWLCAGVHFEMGVCVGVEEHWGMKFLCCKEQDDQGQCQVC